MNIYINLEKLKELDLDIVIELERVFCNIESLHTDCISVCLPGMEYPIQHVKG